MTIHALIVAFLLVYLLQGLEDFVLDCLALARRAWPRELSGGELAGVRALPQKRIAVLVAAWREDGVLERMVQGNLRRLAYANHDFFLAVYPNDVETRERAERLARRHERVYVALNPLPGPTSKGQNLNEAVISVLESELERGIRYDAFVIQDSEDLMHPESLAVMNWRLDTHDFVQVPVYALRTPWWQAVAGTYMDEFAEHHTKNLALRHALGAPVPSAGVGTAVSRRLMLSLLRANGGRFLNDKTLTEDYQLGIQSRRLGFRSAFAAYYLVDGEGGRDLIATREHFPRRLRASVRQRSRWTLGIAFQGSSQLGWARQALENFYLWRDRKAVANHLLVAGGWVLFGILLLRWICFGFVPSTFGDPWAQLAVNVNTFFMLNRFAHRARSVAFLYGWAAGLLSVLRIPVTNFVNLLASSRAAWQFAKSRFEGRDPAWLKTLHELPDDFGVLADEALDQHGVHANTRVLGVKPDRAGLVEQALGPP